MNSALVESFGIGAHEQALCSRATTPVPGDLENRILRQAVRENLVSFPSQVPVFGKPSRPDLQQKSVLLYFVCGWTMEDIAKRYCLGRQRMGQVLTAWRIRAVKQGYIQAIDPEHPQFKQVRPQQTSQFAEMPARTSSVVAPAPKTRPAVLAFEFDEPRPAPPAETELSGPNLAEQLHAIIGILDNQLLLCSKHLNRNTDSCEPLLARAKALCARLEAQRSSVRTNKEVRARAVISAARELFRRFQEHGEHSGVPSKPEFGRGNPMSGTRTV
jgi:hypothetical protein